MRNILYSISLVFIHALPIDSGAPADQIPEVLETGKGVKPDATAQIPGGV
jgi:hypothetical protein